MKSDPNNALLVSLLTVGNVSNNEKLLEQVCRSARWNLLRARNKDEARSIMFQNPVQVVLSEDSPECSWRDMLGVLRKMKNPPQLVVTSRLADEHLWAEVLNMGGFDVLAQPLNADEVERVIDAAGRHYQFQDQAPLRALTA